MTEAEVRATLSSNFRNFEDTLQHFAPKPEGNVSAIVTRYTADYLAREILVLSPDEFLARRESPAE